MRIFWGILYMLIIAAALGVGFYFYARAGRYFAHGVIYIAPMLNESHLHFNPVNIDLLERAFPDYHFAAESRGSARITTAFQNATTTVIYTDTSYFSKHSINFIDGTHWHNRENVIVLNEALAWRLFGTTQNIAGLVVQINDLPIVVTGVVDSANGYVAWMPHARELASLPVTALYIRPENHNPLSVYQARNMLTMHLGGRLSDYAVVDISRFVESMQVRNRILLYIVLVGLMIALLPIIWSSTKMRIIYVVFGVAAAVFILLGVSDILSWLPNLANLNVFESITMIGVLPPDGYLPYGLAQIARLSRFVNYAFIAGLIGLANLIIHNYN